MAPYLHVLRSKRLRARVSAKMLWLYQAPQFAEEEVRPIKIRVTAQALGTKPRTVRRALAQLLTAQFLECVKPPTSGTAGLYRIGTAATQSQRESLRTRAKAGSPADYPLTSAR